MIKILGDKGIKMKKYKLLISIFLSFLLIGSLSNLVDAKGSGKIEFVEDPTYSLIKEDPPKYRYKIQVTLINNDDVVSSPLDIRLYENGNPAVICDNCDSIVFNPNEEKTLFFDWNSTTKEKTLEIKFKPVDPNNNTQYNVGNKSFTIGKINKNNDSLPGFETILIILSILTLIYFKKKRLR